MDLIKQQLQEIAELQKSNSELYKELGFLQEEIESYKASVEELNDKCILTEKELLDYKKNSAKELHRKEEDILLLDEKLMEKEKLIEVLNQELVGLKMSFSWRITEPLRIIRWRLKTRK